MTYLIYVYIFSLITIISKFDFFFFSVHWKSDVSSIWLIKSNLIIIMTEQGVYVVYWILIVPSSLLGQHSVVQMVRIRLIFHTNQGSNLVAEVKTSLVDNMVVLFVGALRVFWFFLILLNSQDPISTILFYLFSQIL
jgi:hypothetical protein